MTDAVSRSRALVERGDLGAAASLLKQSEEQGDALAARELALWCLTGQLIRRDLTTSRALFERAAQLGDDYSAAVARAFVAGGIGGPRDWLRAMSLLERAAETNDEARAQLNLIGEMELGAQGEPTGHYESRTLSDAPEIRLFPGLFSPAECDYVIKLASLALKPSFVIDPLSGREVPNAIRTSEGASFPYVEENPALHALNRRLAAASGTDVRAGEPLQVLRYAPGQQYREHSDALPGVPPGQQRVLTFVVYLDEDYEGGETSFPRLGIKVRGRRGDGLLFRNATSAGVPDPLALHAGLPVTSGVKHLASRWIRAAPLVVD